MTTRRNIDANQLHVDIFLQVRGEWNLGLHLCIAWTGSDVILSTASIMHLCSIALYRYHGIAHPFRGHKRNKVSYLIVPAWIVSITLSIPFIIQAFLDPTNVLESFQLEKQKFLCGIYNRTFATYSSLVSFFIPLVVMSTVDILSVQTLRRQASMPRTAVFSSSPEKITLEGSIRNQQIEENFERKHFFDGREIEMSRSKGFKNPEESCSPGSDRCSFDRKKEQQGLKKNRFCYDSFTTAESSQATKDAADSRDRRRQKMHSDFVDGRASCAIKEERTSSGELRESTPLSRPRSKSLFYLNMLASGGSFKINGRERRAERTLIWVFAVFVILWLPFFCTNLIYGVCSSCNVPPALFQTFVWLGYLSSGVNPCIYTLLNRDFRTAFHRILTCRRQSFRREIIMSHSSVRTARRSDWNSPVYLSAYRRPLQN